MNLALLIGGIFFASLAILSEVGLVPGQLDIVCGPLVMVCIIGWIWPYARANRKFGHVVLVALVLSLCADIAIKFSFIAGLAVFLLAHIAYLVAFIPKASLRHALPPALVYGTTAVGIGAWILPGAMAQGMLWPVIIYMCFVTLMAVTLAAAAFHQRGAFARAGIGGALFFVSDAVIGIGKFAYDFPYSAAVVLITYWAAQLLIASVLVKTTAGSSRQR